jgi:NADH dehydrogenase
VKRFVFVSASGVREPPMANTPLGRGKIATEDRLAASTMREVVLRPDQFQEVWLSPAAQFDWPARKAVIFGTGETPARYVAIDDVAAAAVRLTLADDPPRLVEFGGPDAVTRKQAIQIFERALGEPFRRRTVPRAALRVGSVALRRARPGLASIMGAALGADLHAPTWDDRPLRDLGIEPRSVEEYARTVTAG